MEENLEDPRLHMDFLRHLAGQAQEEGNTFAADHLRRAAHLLEGFGPHLNSQEQELLLEDVAYEAALALNPQGAADILARKLERLV